MDKQLWVLLCPVDLLSLAPPYNQGLVAPALRQLEYGDWITPDAVAIVETDAEEELEIANWEQLDERLYGDTKVRIYRYSTQA
ncbi:MAG TPA: hypothetical protein DDZ43_10610 [Hyphomonadaceae bacterium]|nr:hypothetical protein [Hyphomonadaceae bacterium]